LLHAGGKPARAAVSGWPALGTAAWSGAAGATGACAGIEVHKGGMSCGLSGGAGLRLAVCRASIAAGATAGGWAGAARRTRSDGDADEVRQLIARAGE
jgi:hypothetical protein